MSKRSRPESTPPQPDEFEVSIFGPGKGEAIAVHVGGGDWVTVDSCVEQTTKRHPVLEYFEKIGVDAGRQVRLVVGSHAHDDHVAGISKLFRAAQTAKFVSSPALTSEEFFRAVEADADIEEHLRQSVRREFAGIHDEVKRRGVGSDGLGSWMRATVQRVLWSRAAYGATPATRVVALSPSDVACQRAEALLAEGLAEVGSRRRLAASDPNEFSVALWVDLGDASVLLGADLERGPAGCGWQAVVRTHHPGRPAGLHKVPHHGSKHAHLQQVWDDLLSDDVVSVLAPFRNGSVTLPTDDDVARLVSLSSAVYSSASPKAPSASKAVHRTAAALTGVAQNVREPYGLVGQVRARLAIGSPDWVIELFAPARRMR